MAGWIGQAWRRGIVTSRYPAAAPTEAETPPTAHPPTPAAEAPVDFAEGERQCPTSAIRDRAVDQGACIRCARCRPAGFVFEAPPDLAASTRAELTWPEGRPPAPVPAPPGLVGFERSIHVFLVDVGSCNACNLEALALANPYYDSQRLGIFFTNSPRHADVLLVVGVPAEPMIEPVRRAYEALPAPKAVVAAGVCAIDGGLFRENAGIRGPLDHVLPVSVYVPGCPPTPIALLAGLRRAAGRGSSGRDPP